MNRTVPTALILAAACLSTTACTSTSAPAPDPTSPTVGITTHSVVTSGTGLPPTTDQLTAWWTGGGKAHLTKVGDDFGQLHTGGTDSTAIHADCAQLSTDVSAALAYKPIPDPTAQQHWAAGLDDYQQGATDCLAGTSSMDTTLINEASAKFDAGTAEFNAVTARLQGLAASG